MPNPGFAPPGVCWVTRCGAGVEIAEKHAKVPIKSEVQVVAHPRLTGVVGLAGDAAGEDRSV